jgi:hypothetical protein
MHHMVVHTHHMRLPRQQVVTAQSKLVAYLLLPQVALTHAAMPVQAALVM